MNAATIFDLDGVLTDTARLHFQSWRAIASELGLPFDEQANEALRGLGRMESLLVLLGPRADGFSIEQRNDLTARKNAIYVERVKAMTPADALPGARELLSELQARGVAVALASSSRNSRLVLDRLEMALFFDSIVDGNDVQESKPSPALFLEAARRLGIPPSRCVVVEDAASGIEAAQAANMRVLGVGPASRVGKASRVCDSLARVNAATLLALLDD